MADRRPDNPSIMGGLVHLQHLQHSDNRQQSLSDPPASSRAQDVYDSYQEARGYGSQRPTQPHASIHHNLHSPPVFPLPHQQNPRQPLLPSLAPHHLPQHHHHQPSLPHDSSSPSRHTLPLSSSATIEPPELRSEEQHGDRTAVVHTEADGEVDNGGGGRLAISFLLNPSAAAAATSTTSSAVTPAGSPPTPGHKRKAESPPLPSPPDGYRWPHHSPPPFEQEEKGEDRHRRRRVEHDSPEAADAQYHPRPQQQHHHYHPQPYLHQHHHQLPPAYDELGARGPIPPLSPLYMSSTPSLSFDTFTSPRAVLPSISSIRAASQTLAISPEPGPSLARMAIPHLSTSSTPSALSLSPFSPDSSSSFGLSLSAANSSFFFNSFNCLPSVVSQDKDFDSQGPSPHGGSGSLETGNGFFYDPYEPSRSMPTSPKIFAEDTGPEEEEEEDVPTQPALDPEQVRLRLQTQALQTQLLLRQLQRKQSVQQLKQLHAHQRRLRSGEAERRAVSAATSSASSPTRRTDDDDDDDDDDELGESDERLDALKEDSAIAKAQQARKIEDKLNLLKLKIMNSGELNDDEAKDDAAQEKRKRATPQQLKLLEDVFSLDPFPAREAKQLLAQKLGMSVRSITIWFQNKRARLKKFGEKNAM